MRYKINNIVDFKRYIENNSFDRYIIEVDHTLELKMVFLLAKICIAPDLIYFADEDGNYICIDKIKTVKGTGESVEICRSYHNFEQKIVVHCQHN